MHEGRAAKRQKQLSLRELWRVGTDDEVFFGEVSSVISNREGHVYVLDSQQCQVYVFGPAGQLVQTLSREGDGPGEVRHPAGIFFTDDARMAIVRSYPAGLIFLDQAGIPAGQMKIPALGSKSEGLYFLDDATPIGAVASGDMVIAGGADQVGSNQPERVRFIARFTRDATVPRGRLSISAARS